jgi:hypothetical protein
MDRIPQAKGPAPLYRQGSGYSLGGRLSGCQLLHGCTFGVIF